MYCTVTTLLKMAMLAIVTTITTNSSDPTGAFMTTVNPRMKVSIISNLNKIFFTFKLAEDTEKDHLDKYL